MSRLKKLQKRLNETLDTIDVLADKAASDERDFDDDEKQQYETLKASVEEIKGQIAREQEIEELAKARAIPVEPKPEHITGGTPNTPKKTIKAKLFVDMARAMYHGGGRYMPAIAIADQLGLKEASAIMKAVVNPADTATATWAAELMREGYGDFIELLRPKSVYARAPGMSAVLGRNGKLLFPGMTTGVAGGWVGEGKPIPMAQGVLNEQETMPYKLGVITAHTRELMERSDPSSDAIIRDSMVRDTAVVLDTTFVSDNVPVPGVSPAGIRNGITPVDFTPAGATNTIEELDAGFAAMVGACLSAHMDTNLFWMMSPLNKLKLRNRSTATGTYPYRDELDGMMLMGYSVLDSATVPDTVIILVHGDSLYKLVEGSIMLDMSTDATVHTSTAPEQIVSGGATPALPAEGNVRSAFQEDSVYLRLVMPASWGVMRTDAVQTGANFVI